MACFDHLVVGIRALDEGIDQFEQLLGVKPAVGGQHPGRWGRGRTWRYSRRSATRRCHSPTQSCTVWIA